MKTMKVKELIEQLEKLDGEKEVFIEGEIEVASYYLEYVHHEPERAIEVDDEVHIEI